MDVEQQILVATKGWVCFDMVTTRYRFNYLDYLDYLDYLNTFKRMRTRIKKCVSYVTVNVNNC